MGKPVFVASQLLNSMIDVPVPTRAEVADCADAVRQQADALMLSGETAAGMYPVKAVQTLQSVRSPRKSVSGPCCDAANRVPGWPASTRSCYCAGNLSTNSLESVRAGTAGAARHWRQRQAS